MCNIKLVKYLLIIVVVFITLYLGIKIVKQINFNPKYKVGDVIDSFNNVKVYFNGGIGHTEGRNLTKDGYNLGMKYQCVEFVKRYYYEVLNHKMPDTYGNAIDFFDIFLKDGELNKKRALYQYYNGSVTPPKVNDIIVFKKSLFNPYGHVAIVIKVSENNITIIQQNAGPFAKTREVYRLHKIKNHYFTNKKILGWLSIKGKIDNNISNY